MYQNHTQCIKEKKDIGDLNIKSKTIKLSEKMEEKLRDIGF